MKSIEEIDLKSKKVLIRADLNVPFAEDGSISDDHRIKASLKTIDYVLKNGGAAVVSSHLGQPKGADPKFSLKPVAKRLGELLGVAATIAPDSVGEEVEKMAASLSAGELLVLENTRFHPEEKKNAPEHAEKLAKLADVYINDAFASDHRSHASTVGVASHFNSDSKGAGFTLMKEIEFFSKATTSPARPLIAVFGGAKVSTKMTAIRNVAKLADAVIVGGAMANTFFAAEGLNIGKSLYEEEQAQAAKEALEFAAQNDCKLILPTDVIVAEEFSATSPQRACAIDQIKDAEMALDIGPESIAAFSKALEEAKTIVWNGPMGAFEMEPFSKGTYAIVDALVASSALTVVGGGDTDLALTRRQAMDKMDYVSTGGGAFLHLLEGKELPGVSALS
ncbi:UNVERIFIED_CONTAM: hypothetical protein GTU68_023070 [Idotea baltica]|nr:hypothetical protein [Idotea baltica]